MQDEIVNRVANSSIVTFDLEEYYPVGDRILLDIKDQLYQGLVLKEKDFRDFIRNHDWSQYQNKFVAITCSTEAIIPTWAYMLVAIALRPFVKSVEFGTLEQLEEKLYQDVLAKVNWDQFHNARVVVKGCSKVNVPASAYVTAVSYLQPIVASLMFGEACSTVPLFKRAHFGVKNQ
jgi:hypothetical protein